MTREGLRPQRPPESPAPFDFRSPERIPDVQIQGIRVVFEQGLRSVSSALTGYLGIPVALRLVDIEQLSFPVFREGLSTPTCLVDLGLSATPHHGVMEIGLAVVFPMLEILLGAKAGKAADIQRELTDIEQHVATGLFRPIVDELGQALCNTRSGELEMMGIACNPSLVPVLEADAGAVIFTAEMDIAGNQGLIRLALPAATVKMMKGADRRAIASQNAAAAPSLAVFELLSAASIRLEVRLDGETLRLQDLAALKVDDVLSFGRESEQMLECSLNGLIRFRGHLAAKGAKMCFRIEECETRNPGTLSPALPEITGGQP